MVIEYVDPTETVTYVKDPECDYSRLPYRDERITINGEEFPVYLMASVAMDRIRDREATAEMYERKLCAA